VKRFHDPGLDALKLALGPPDEDDPPVEPVELRECLDPEELAGILRGLDPSDPGSAERAPERLAVLLHDPDRLAAALGRLPAASLVLLELLTEIPDRRLDAEVARREVERRLGQLGCGAEAEQGLVRAGLLPQVGRRPSGRGGALLLPGCLARPIRPLVRGLVDRTLAPAEVTVTRPGVDLGEIIGAVAVLAGDLERDPPRVTQVSQLYTKAVETLKQVYFPADQPGGLRFGHALRLAERLRLVRFQPGRVTVHRTHLERLAGLPVEAQRDEALRLLLQDHPHESEALVRDLRSRQGEGYVPLALLASRLAVTRHSIPRRWPERQPHRGLASRDAPVASGLARLRRLPFVTLGRTADGEEGVRFPAPGSAPGATRAYVQPNLDILLPLDADPLLVHNVARIAEVRRVESVVQLALKERSIRSARRSGLSAEEIQAILERVAPGAVPANVRTLVADWAAGPAPVRFVRGVVVHCPDPGPIEAVKRTALPAASQVIELAPGMWVVDPGAVVTVQRALGQARIAFRPEVESPTAGLGTYAFDADRAVPAPEVAPPPASAPRPRAELVARVAATRTTLEPVRRTP
jgi:hypothetical protein